jgi:hypothetical protein
VEASLENTGFSHAHRLSQRVGHGALESRIVFDWNEMRVVLPEPGKHPRVHIAGEVVHEEGAEDRQVMLVGELVEQIFEAHACGHVTPLPQNVHHLSPPPHLGGRSIGPRFRDDIRGQAEENWSVGHTLPHEVRKELVGVDDGQLMARLRGLHIDSLGFQPWTDRIPVRCGRDQDDPFTVFNGRGGEAANRPT